MRVYCKPCGKIVDGLDKLQPKKGNPSDYSQPCTPTEGLSVRCPESMGMCMVDVNCDELTEGCGCPDPLPNSHWALPPHDCVRVIDITCQRCVLEFPYYCRDYGRYHCTGNCYYDCDEGYEWDGEACVPIEVAKPFFKGDGLTWIVMKH